MKKYDPYVEGSCYQCGRPLNPNYLEWNAALGVLRLHLACAHNMGIRIHKEARKALNAYEQTNNQQPAAHS